MQSKFITITFNLLDVYPTLALRLSDNYQICKVRAADPIKNMTRKKPMILILTASVAAISTVLYNLFQKITPAGVNPVLALAVTYGVAFLATLMLFAFFPSGNLSAAFQKLNWVSFALGLAIVGLEVGTLLAYRAGWELSLLGITVNVVGSLILVTLGVVFFKEKLTIINLIGILVCIGGLFMINFKH